MVAGEKLLRVYRHSVKITRTYLSLFWKDTEIGIKHKANLDYSQTLGPTQAVMGYCQPDIASENRVHRCNEQ